MTIADSQQQRLLDQLRQTEGRQIAFAELRAGGVTYPAVVAAELELNGYHIERGRDRERLTGIRLRSPEPTQASDQIPRHRRMWPTPPRPRRRINHPAI